MQPGTPPATLSVRRRRSFLALCSQLGLASTVFPGLVWAELRRTGVITRETLDHAAIVAGIEIPEEQKTAILDGVNEQVRAFDEIRGLKLDNQVAPPLLFEPMISRTTLASGARQMRMSAGTDTPVPAKIEDIAFASVRQLGDWVRTRRISSVSLTKIYLERLRRYDKLLRFVITLTPERGMAQAQQADEEIARGVYRGPLHGIPWGAKDLLSAKGYPTTWGASGFEQQRFDSDATVVERLDAAGAVLVAKLSLGTLAMGADEWFGGMTRNPWNPEQGASGSSAGSASAVAAGCVPFAIGSETLDSISSPCDRCGATGLRPTFGRVPRTGAMALCWSLDKLGPICRTVEDCAFVLAAINGSDGKDLATRDVSFDWDTTLDVQTLRVGYLEGEFQGERRGIAGTPTSISERSERQRVDQVTLDVIRNLGINLKPVDLPKLPWRAMLTVAKTEAAAAFDGLTRAGRDKLLPHQKRNWPNVFRIAHFTPAVEYVNANRSRTLGMRAVAKIFEQFDVLVAPTISTQLIVTNMTGHPAVIVPNGFRDDSTPTTITFLGDLFGESKMLALARAYQENTVWHTKRPSL